MADTRTPQQQPAARTFSVSPAVRKQVPLLIGLIGPSGGGKTPSALRLATGIRRVTGGRIIGFDTESDRMLHYAPRAGQKPDTERLTFDFSHIPFSAPFGPLDYLAAITQNIGPTDIGIIDSMSHEHEGPGGVLEAHAVEQHRLSGGDAKKYEAVNFSAWAKPKGDRRRLINTILQMKFGALIFCFRAKEKLKITKEEAEAQNGRKYKKTVVVNQGWQAIGGEEFVYELGVRFLLPPGANGIPRWTPEEEGEKETIRLPAYFVDALQGREKDAEGEYYVPIQINEDMGEKMAVWAAGGDASATPALGPGAPLRLKPTIADLRKRIATYESKIGKEAFLAILGKHGAEDLEAIDNEKQAGDIGAELKELAGKKA